MKKKITLCVWCLVGWYVSLWAQSSGGDTGGGETPPPAPVTYTINFHAGADGVGGGMTAQSVPEADVATAVLTANVFTRTGHTFAGWATAQGGGKAYDDQAAVSTIAFPEGETSIDLYALWTANTYRVEFKHNTGNVAQDDMPDQLFTYGECKALSECTYVKLVGDKDFQGWGTSKDGPVVYADKQNVCMTEEGINPELRETVTLYAQWKPRFRGFTLHLDQNGSSSPDVADITVTAADKDKTVPACSFTRRGYVFTGWNTGRDGLGTPATPGETPYSTLDRLAVGGRLTLYAQWRPITYMIRYEPNLPDGVSEDKLGGTMADQTLTWDEPAVISDPEKGIYKLEGYNLEFWCTQPAMPEDELDGYIYEKGEEVTNILPAGEVTEGQVLTLYAQWEGIVYGVRFHANADDAVGGMDMQSIRYDERARLKACTITRPGYVFASWSTHPDVTAPNDTVPEVHVYEDGAEVYRLSTEMEAEVNLYAHWKPITYEVVFDPNRGEGNVGEGTMAAQTFTYATPQALTANAFTRAGYRFASWNLLADGSGRSYADRATADSLVTEQGKTRTLYAQWTPNTYRVRFDKNSPRATGSMAEQLHTYDASLALAPNAYTHPDSVFLGWVTDPAETENIRFRNGEEVRNLTPEADVAVALYALWGDKEYFVRFLPNGAGGEQTTQRFVYTEPEKLDPCPFTRTGYTFRGWALTPEGAVRYDERAEVAGLTAEAGGVVSLYAVWEENAYTIRFRPATDEISDYMPSISLRYSEPGRLPANTYTRTGHSFTGWNTGQGGTGTDYADGQEVQGLSAVDGEVITLYALWRRHRYTLHYEANGGEGTMSDQELEYNQAETALIANAFTRTGYTFTGWDAVIGGEDTHFADRQPVQNLTAADDTTLTLTAGWREHGYTLRYHRNVDGGTVPAEEQHVMYSESTRLRGNTFTRTGYTFTGWALTPDGEKAYDNNAEISRLTAEDEAVIDLYALWTANRYTVAFHGNGGEGAMEALQLTYDGATATLPANGFTRTGYTFSGWNTAADGRGTAYAVGQELKNLSAVPDGLITLYARWSVNSYSVAYDGNGGEGTMEGFTIDYDERRTLDLNRFTRTGHTYEGWNTAADGEGTAYADGAEVYNWTAVDGDRIILHARWRAHRYTVIYVPNGGEGDMPNQEFAYGEQQALTPNAFTREGYTFSGWNTKMNGTGTDYADGATVGNLTAKDGDFVGLYARWTPRQYNIVFRNDDGTVLQSGRWDYDSTPAYTGETPVKASTADYDYEFVGWTPAIVPVTADAEYTAVYRATERTYLHEASPEGMTVRTESLHIYISGIGDEEEVQVFDLNARPVYSGTSRDIEVPAPGLYMLCRAGETVKVMVR